MDLRRRILHVAHDHPETRNALLPLLRRTVGAESKITKTQSDALDKWVTQAYKLFRPDAPNPEELARDMAFTAGSQAKRMGLSKEQLSGWLQGAYGRLWVRLGNLNPGMDMKDVRKAVMKAYDAKR